MLFDLEIIDKLLHLLLLSLDEGSKADEIVFVVFLLETLEA